MKKSIKRLIATLILVLGIFQVPTMVFADINIPSATSDFYVNDFATVFSDDEKARLMDNAVTLADEHDGIQVVVTTVKSLEGNTVENYALEMYNQYGIGKNDMGLLILLSTKDRQLRIEVGRAMEAYITDSKAGRLADEYAIPYLKEDKFNEGLISLQEALIAEIVTNVESTATSTSSSEDSLNFLGLLGGFILICSIVGVIILIFICVRKLIAKRREKQREIEDLLAQKQDLIKLLAIANQKINHRECEIDLLSVEKNNLNKEYSSLETKYTVLQDRYERVTTLYPTADKEVTDMIEEEIRQRNMQLAKEVDSVIKKVIDLPASKDILSELSHAKSSYSNLSEEQKSYVTSNITKLNQLYDESLELKQEYDRLKEEERKKKLAAEAVAAITAIISGISIGRARHLSKLRKAKSIYDNLESGASKYFDNSVAEELNKLYKQAKRDKQEEEEAERRRRRDDDDSSGFGGGFGSGSIGGSGSGFGGFGGFGGSSGGGGASRGF